jgi:hypothetical protein
MTQAGCLLFPRHPRRPVRDQDGESSTAGRKLIRDLLVVLGAEQIQKLGILYVQIRVGERLLVFSRDGVTDHPGVALDWIRLPYNPDRAFSMMPSSCRASPLSHGCPVGFCLMVSYAFPSPMQVATKASVAGESGFSRSVTNTNGLWKVSPRSSTRLTTDPASSVRVGTTPISAPAATAPSTAACR